ncbi:hypothetical protein VPH35_025855 [Triticum aestivum]
MESVKEFAHRRFQKLGRWFRRETAAGDGLQVFALGLNKRLADDAGRSGNLVFSPLSVYAALSLVAAGARDRTLDELLGVLGAPSRDFLAGHVRALAKQVLADRSRTGGPRVSFASGVWHDRTMKQINSWVSSSTNGLIPSLVGRGALSNLTDLVLANAIYFKGKWAKPFDKYLTKNDKFHRLDGTAVDAPFMRGLGMHSIACHDGFKVLQLRYEEGRRTMWSPGPIYSMCVFLPDACDGLWRLTDKIVCNPDFLRQHLPRSTVLVDDFRMPKFKVTFGMTMNNVLQEMGVKEVFELGKADLSDMAEDGARRKLALEQVIHRAVIEVNEEGTEAAAATYSMAPMCSPNPAPPPPRVDFVADHPFTFFVVEEVSGAILFAGHVLDPTIK